LTFGGHSGDGFETRSMGACVSAGYIQLRQGSYTWTSFSPSETRLTMLARDILSGFGFR
jgi:hypothetical protein